MRVILSTPPPVGSTIRSDTDNAADTYAVMIVGCVQILPQLHRLSTVRCVSRYAWLQPKGKTRLQDNRYTVNLNKSLIVAYCQLIELKTWLMPQCHYCGTGHTGRHSGA